MCSLHTTTSHYYLDEMSSSAISSESWRGTDASSSSSPRNSVNQQDCYTYSLFLDKEKNFKENTVTILWPNLVVKLFINKQVLKNKSKNVNFKIFLYCSTLKRTPLSTWSLGFTHSTSKNLGTYHIGKTNKWHNIFI